MRTSKGPPKEGKRAVTLFVTEVEYSAIKENADAARRTVPQQILHLLYSTSVVMQAIPKKMGSEP